MTFSPEFLLTALEPLVSARPPLRFHVAYSGGLDSTVLLHAISASKSGVPVMAVHVNHGLHADAADWAAHCRRQAAEWGVPFRCLEVSVPERADGGPEAAARAARYTAIAGVLGADDWLLSAHHRDDQAETLLLNLLRGSGAAGLAGMGPLRRLGDGWLARPLLETGRDELQDYAAQHDLRWLEDPSNSNERYDRNYLRNTVMPVLQRRWTATGVQLARSAALATETAQLLDELADIDIERLGQPARIDCEGLKALGDSRARNVLRRAAARLKLPIPPRTRLEQVCRELLPARDDATPLVRWPGAEVRRFRGALFMLAADSAAVTASQTLTGGETVSLGSLGRLQLVPGQTPGIAHDLVAGGLQIRFRQGGEALRPCGSKHTRKLKKLLQEAAIVPWIRDKIPLLYAGDRLVAVADLWLAADAVASNGFGVTWHDRPLLSG